MGDLPRADLGTYIHVRCKVSFFFIVQLTYSELTARLNKQNDWQFFNGSSSSARVHRPVEYISETLILYRGRSAGRPLHAIKSETWDFPDCTICYCTCISTWPVKSVCTYMYPRIRVPQRDENILGEFDAAEPHYSQNCMLT